MSHLHSLLSKLDLQDFIDTFTSFFARQKDFVLDGDRALYAQILKELESIPFQAPPPIHNLDTPIVHLQKHGTLKLDEIFEFIQLIRYFNTLKKTIKDNAPRTFAWLEKILIPPPLLDLEQCFTSKGEFKEGIYPEIDALKSHIKSNKAQITNHLNQLLHTTHLTPYLVNHNVHYINQNECLLLKAGYNHAIKGMVLERSHSGFFYLMPDSVIRLKERQSTLIDSLEESLYRICREISHTLNKHLLFLKFLDKEFDKFDHIHARLGFAKTHNLQFAYELNKQKEIILSEFAHPALSNPKPLDFTSTQHITMVTGVNAGGKTMLLKSALSACILGKYLLPFRFNPHKSKIPYFKHIVAIIADPQNSKNNISTFAGRMLEFSQILNTQDLLLGIDEIELGTDADEAASLYKVLLEHLLDKNTKIILTTHHKHLAALMAGNPKVQLCAALYDIQAQKPLFEFLNGSIGKSYAFESAQRYGIPATLIAQAKATYGEDKERLNELIERSSELEIIMKRKTHELEEQIKQYELKIQALERQSEAQKSEFQSLKHHLESTYTKATQVLKEALKAKEGREIHKAFNDAHSILQHTTPKPSTAPTMHSQPPLKIGDSVKYKSSRGRILSIKGTMCVVELEGGFKLKEKLENLKKIHSPKPKPHTPTIKLQTTKSVGVSLDLHGARGDEAIEKLDQFLSDALIAGYNEVLVYHGIGTGILGKLIKDYLLNHPKILSFDDAPPNMGGFGAKIIKL